jgi:branched-subunit amino acid transport protein
VHAFLILVLAGTATYAVRALPVHVLRGTTLPRGIDRALAVASPAMLAALVAGAAVQRHAAEPYGARAIALAVALPVAVRTGNMIATAACGMTALWISAAALAVL